MPLRIERKSGEGYEGRLGPLLNTGERASYLTVTSRKREPQEAMAR